MRLALVVAGGVDESGSERVIPSLLWLIDRLARRNDLHVFALRYLAAARSYSLLGAQVHDLGRPSGFRRQQRALHAALHTWGPFDLVHGYWAVPAGLHAAISSKRLGVPAVATLDSGEFISVPAIDYGLQTTPASRLAVFATCRLVARVTVCTEYQARLARTFGVSPEIIPLGVDTRLFVPASHRVEGPPWRLIHVASLNRVKDQTLLLEAMRELRRNDVDVHLDVVGEDTLDGAIQRLAIELGLRDDVTFHGFTRSLELVPLYQRSHLAVMTSHHEAAGVATLEAAACGVATIGTNVGYVADWADHGSIAVTSRHASDIASAIARVLEDRHLRDRLAAAAHAFAVANNADWTAARMERLYQEIAQRQPASS